MQVPTHPLLSLLECKATGLKSMLTHYIDATVDSQFASLRNSFETMIQSGVIGPNCDGTHFGMTLPQPTHTNTQQSSDECSHEYSNDTLTREQEHQNNLQNEVSNTINTESMIKQEFDDEEEDGEKIDDDNIGKCENCENGICNSARENYDDTEKGQNGNEHFDTRPNVQAALENNQTNRSIIFNDILSNQNNPINTQPLIKQECLQDSSITSIPLNFANNAALNDISIDGPSNMQNTQIQTDEFDDNDDLDEDANDEGDENGYLNNPNCQDGFKGICDLDHENNKNHFKNAVLVGDEDETILDEAQFQINISAANNTQMNIQNDNTENCVSERNMEQSTPSTSGVRSSTRKLIQTKVFGDLVQSNGNTHQGKDQTTNAIGEQIATECTTNPIQPNLAQPNRHLHFSHCNKSFDRNSTLQKHLRVHTGERSFQCDQCGKKFSLKSSLTKHQLIHQNIKRFQCDQCERQFTQKVHLEIHLRTHSGERPHQCRFCVQSFSHLHVRNNHEQAIHLHVKPYRCKQCGLTATRQSAIIKHIRMVHFGLPRSIKQQRALNIIDERDPKEFIEKV